MGKKQEITKLLDEIEEHSYQWNLQGKCNCMPKSELVSRENLIICKHLKKDRRKKFGKRCDDQYNISLLEGGSNLYNFLESRRMM